MTINPNVQAGVAWLDTVYPEWPQHIDVDRLNMDGTFDCILGQIFGSYYTLPVQVINDGVTFMQQEKHDAWMQWTIDHGFLRPDDMSPSMLQHAWEDIVIAKQA